MARCQAEVDSAEFTEWVAFNAIDPWTEARQDLRHAALLLNLYNFLPGKKPRRGLEDFILRFDAPERRPPTGAEMDQRLLRWMQGMGARGAQ